MQVHVDGVGLDAQYAGDLCGAMSVRRERDYFLPTRHLGELIGDHGGTGVRERQRLWVISQATPQIGNRKLLVAMQPSQCFQRRPLDNPHQVRHEHLRRESTQPVPTRDSARLSATTTDCCKALTCTNQTQPDRPGQKCGTWHAEGSGFDLPADAFTMATAMTCRYLTRVIAAYPNR
jgi:hypothetical protein